VAIFRIIGENPDVFEGESFVRGIRSLYNYSAREIEIMKKHMDHWFRCYDDDGVLYFWGRCSSQSFDPLDFGEQYGCTSIEYKNPSTGVWEVL